MQRAGRLERRQQRAGERVGAPQQRPRQRQQRGAEQARPAAEQIGVGEAQPQSATRMSNTTMRASGRPLNVTGLRFAYSESS
jgi:hypothetical protein